MWDKCGQEQPVNIFDVIRIFVFIFSHTVNLLTNIPRDCYEELLIPLNEIDIEGVENKDVEFDGRNMEAIIVLLNFLYNRLDRVRTEIVVRNNLLFK